MAENQVAEQPKFVPFHWSLMREWFRSPTGQVLLQKERALLDDIVNQLFGYHLLLLGEPPMLEALSASPIQHRIVVHPQLARLEEAQVLCSRLDKIAIDSEAIDVAVIGHSLEFMPDPHEVLREVYRVMLPEGHLVLINFNPWSLWGLWRLFARFVKNVPWQGKFRSIGKLSDWLHLLGFEIKSIHACHFSLPFGDPKWLKRFHWLEYLGEKCWPLLGGAHIIVAKKRVLSLTPIRPEWSKQENELAGDLVEPTTRKPIAEQKNG